MAAGRASRVLAGVVALSLLLVACGDDAATPGATATPTPTWPVPTPTGEQTASPTPTPTPPDLTEVFALHRYKARMPDTWREPIVIPYGPDASQLGTSLGGDGAGVQWGPSYGTLAADGTWWILDGAKLRFAHYDAAGAYLGAVAIPPEHLVDGRYMQWQYPLGLADGTIVTFRLGGPSGTTMLALRDGVLTEVTLDREVVVKTDDGVRLYGLGPQGELLSVDVATGSVSEVEAFRSRTGYPYRLARDGSELQFELPERGVEHRWPQVAVETDSPAAGAISLASSADGRLHVFIDGAAEDEEQTGRSGYAVIGPDGDLRATEPTRDPWSPSDDGSGSRLVARPGGNEVWFITIDTDAVRLYQRA